MALIIFVAIFRSMFICKVSFAQDGGRLWKNIKRDNLSRSLYSIGVEFEYSPHFKLNNLSSFIPLYPL